MRFTTILLVSTACLGLGEGRVALAKPIPYTQLSTSHHRVTRTKAPKALVADGIVAANSAALQSPQPESYLNAIQVYNFMDGAIYRLFATPDKVSDICLQVGEDLIAISAGDTARWVIGDTHSGEGAGRQVHVLVKPYTIGLKTNLIITTNRRTYHLQLDSSATASMAAIAWHYPQDELVALKAAKERATSAAPVLSGLVAEDLNFQYVVSGDRPAWRPLHVFDDGQKTYIVFPPTLGQGEAPPLFVIGQDLQAQLVNYRVSRNAYIVDRLFDIAELRLGAKRQAVVRITRVASGRATMPAGIGAGHD